MIPKGFCQCGCGLPTAVSNRNDATLGYVKGEPFRYIPSHNRRIRRAGYRMMRTGRGSVHEHVVVAERALGKPLPPEAEVHHVDGDKRNNENRNLVICPDYAYHALLHARAAVVKAGGDPNTQKFCTVCKRPKPFTDFNRNSKSVNYGLASRCRECAKRAWHEQAKKRAKGAAA